MNNSFSSKYGVGDYIHYISGGKLKHQRIMAVIFYAKHYTYKTHCGDWVTPREVIEPKEQQL